MKRCIFYLACALAFACARAEQEAEKFSVDIIGLSFLQPLPRNLPYFMRHPRASNIGLYHNPGIPRFELRFLLSGEGITNLPATGVDIEFIKTPDGRDVSRDYRGKPIVQPGFETAGISDDRKNAHFNMWGVPDALVPGEPLHIKGSVTVNYMLASETETITLKTGEVAEQQVGPVFVATELLNETQQNTRLLFLWFTDNSAKHVINFKITMNGETYDSKSRSYSADKWYITPYTYKNKSGYLFSDRSNSPEMTMTLEYTSDVKSRIVPFDLQL